MQCSVSPTDMNQAAIKALQHGDNMQAVEILRKALGDLHANHDEPLRRKVRPAPHKKKASDVALYTVALPTLSCESSLRSVLYNRAFCLPLPQKQQRQQRTSSTSTALDLDGTSCLLFFNIALALHRQGISTGCTDTLQKALFIYKEALQLLENSSSCRKPCFVVVMAALYHNLAALYGEFYCTRESREHRERLAAVFDWEGSLNMGPIDFQFFHVGLWLSRGEDFRLAPAA